MALLDRSLPPKVENLNIISLPSYTQHILSNGIPVYYLPFGELEVCTLRCIFRAGKGYQSQAGLANLTAENMPEGTQFHNGYELAKKLDTYGTWIGHQAGYEQVSFELSTLSKYLPDTLPLLAEVLFSPLFSSEEYEQLRHRKLQKLTVEAEKTRFHALRLFGQHLFGEKHPYGMHVGEKEIQQLSLEHIQSYHATHFYPGNFLLTLVGNCNWGEAIAHLEKELGSRECQPGNSVASASAAPVTFPEASRIQQPHKGVQSTIRIGHKAFPRKHPDYYGMQILNTVLGGYFGSRLMQNIREEKGYTYGISSGWISLAYSGYFVIQADVGNEYVESTLKECKKEMRRLQQDLIPEKELELVKNYLLGSSVSDRETPFQMSDILRFSLVNKVSFKEMDQRFEVIQEITSEELRRLAQKYLLPEQMTEIVVGG